MAGYLFTFSDEESMLDSMRTGVYSTLVSAAWNNPVAATLADYVTMLPGDNVYFFSNRKIYGIGEIVSIISESTAIENYPKATSRERFEYSRIKMNSLLDQPSEGKVKRWLFVFKPAPMLFSSGIDMDDFLATDDEAFKSLRVFWKRTFIKMDERENNAFKAALLRRNLDVLYGKVEGSIECGWEEWILRLKQECEGTDRKLEIKGLLKQSRKADGTLTSEMLLEVGLLHQLAQKDPKTVEVFGK